jgi:ABC-type nitrate/sulfonate/bicarbonate transport system permease component
MIDGLQSVHPWIFTGLKLGTVIGIAILLSAELYASTVGLGFEMAVGGATFQMSRVYAAMFAAAFLVYGFWLCLTAIEFALARRFSANLPSAEPKSD